MRVLITGGTGLIGQVTIERLLEVGWEIRTLDVNPGEVNKNIEQIEGNILHYDDVLKATQGCDGVVHLAAIRTPYMAPPQQVFEVNSAGTFNVFEAAAVSGIKRVVQASSINAFGSYYGTVDVELQYLPLDEDHPSYTTDAYSFSKQTIEKIGNYYWRRDGISSTALRFPGVYRRDYRQTEMFEKRKAGALSVIDELVNLSDAERESRLAEVKTRAKEFRQSRPFDYHPDNPALPNPPPRYPGDVLFNTYAGDRFNLWAVIDERDAAQSIEKSLTVGFEGSHALFVNDRVNYLGVESETLAALFFPSVSARKSALPGAASLISIDRARALIGYEPEFSFA